ncbi:hypothetical protein pkur_cds_39 [Pandoravirus kuranda]|uniref:Ankyrin repeat domain containing protein n=2 Tax=Pandoravirus TaxID=2060084 RepID=A0AA95EHQ7_9VIRU|nr:hypothetical protein pneo_cds_44 [Pandoravirus neocaledonia]AVK75651.1 hypothetical protein pneo_cds_44 [Pandoravirus neocaledonia]WBR14214.1 hypothetical protein pkur_cds_39 [Pandoravirus kuranda]
MSAARTAAKIDRAKMERPHCPVGIADMPSETIWMILGHLANLGSVVNCCAALGRSPGDFIISAAATRPKPFLERGAPVEFVRALARARGSLIPASWLDAAVVGGRLDVIAWLHGVADIDRMCGVDADTWPTVSGARRKQFRSSAQRLLKSAIKAGNTNALEWLLGFYAAPRFAANPLVDRGMIDRLCEWTISFGRNTLEIVDALHRRHPSARCGCRRRFADAAIRADRADVLAWMCASQCGAQLDFDDASRIYDAIHDAIDAKACRVIAWLADRTCRLDIVERLLCEILMLHGTQSQRDAIDIVVRAGLYWPCVQWLCPWLLCAFFDIHDDPRQHPFDLRAPPFLRHTATLLWLVFMSVLVFCLPAVGSCAIGMLIARRY